MKRNYFYIPGKNILPMLAIYNQKNKNVFDEEYKYSYGEWKEENCKYLWNMNAFIIFNDNEIISYKFNEIEYLIWLLRYLNKKIKIVFINKEIEENILKNYFEEFKKT